MKHWICRFKTWLIHKLGGYTQDEATHNRKIVNLAMHYRYTIDVQRESVGEIHFREREKAYERFIEGVVRHYATLDERRDHETREWILRLSMRVVDSDLM